VAAATGPDDGKPLLAAALALGALAMVSVPLLVLASRLRRQEPRR
jgi:hypothetical protein